MSKPADDDGAPDWASVATAKLESLVGTVRDHSTRPVLGFARLASLVVVAVLVGIVVIALGSVAIITLFDHDVFGGRVWATDFMFGGILVVVGTFLLAAGARARRSNG